MLLWQDTLQTLLEHLKGRGWVANPQKIQGSGTAIVFGNYLVRYDVHCPKSCD